MKIDGLGTRPTLASRNMDAGHRAASLEGEDRKSVV